MPRTMVNGLGNYSFSLSTDNFQYDGFRSNSKYKNFFGRVDVWGLISMNLGVRMAWTIKDQLLPSLEMSI